MAPIDITQLYTMHATAVYRYVFLRVQSAADAEDIVSDAFLKAVSKADSYRPIPGATPRSWLYAIVRNTIVDHYRRQDRRQTQHIDEEVLQLSDNTPLPDELADRAFTLESAMSIINTLPERQQEILLLRYQSGLRNTEIAATLGIDQKSVSSLSSKALKKVRAQLLPEQ